MIAIIISSQKPISITITVTVASNPLQFQLFFTYLQWLQCATTTIHEHLTKSWHSFSEMLQFPSSWGAYDTVEDSKSFQFHWIHALLEWMLLVLRTPFLLAQQDEGSQLQLQPAVTPAYRKSYISFCWDGRAFIAQLHPSIFSGKSVVSKPCCSQNG